MTAVYDFFRFIKLYSTDGTTLEHTIEADAVTDTLSISRGAGVAWTGASAATDSFKIDVNYTLEVPVSTTTLRLTDVHSVDQDIVLVAGTNMNIVRDSSSQLTISSLVGGISKAITSITQANPAVIQTTNAHNFTEGTPVTITDVNGMTQLNGNEYYMDILTGTTFALYSNPELTTTVDSTGFGAYTSGGVATGEYGGATKLNELSDVIANVANFTNSIKIGDTTTGTLNAADGNVIMGVGAGNAITSGDNNVLLGLNSGTNFTTGAENVIIGKDAATTSNWTTSIAIGKGAGSNGQITDTPYRDIFIGPYAGSGSDHSQNIIIGYYAGFGLTDNSNDNVAMGYNALQNSKGTGGATQNSNVAIGSYSMVGQPNISEQKNNTAIGYESAKVIVDGEHNVFVGYQAGVKLTSADYNTFVGNQAGSEVTTGDGNVIIGRYVGTATLTDTVAIYTHPTGGPPTERLTIDSTGGKVNGNPIVTSNSISGTVTGHIIPDTNIAYDLGSSTHKFRDLYLDGTSLHLGSTILRDDGAGNLQVNLTNVLQIAADDSTIRTINSGESIKFVGAGGVSTATDAEGNLTITAPGSLNDLSDIISDITDFGNSIIIGHNTTGVLNGAARNTFIGLPGNSTSAGTFAAGQTITSGDDNTGIGAGALSKITSGSHNTAVGSAALGGPYSQTDFITHSYSTAVGGYAGWRSKEGYYNTLVGYSAGKDMETGGNNTAVGAIAMQSMVSGDTNVAVGYFALDNPEQGNDNVAIGARALLGGTATSPGPLRNVVIGRDAGFVITTATDNVLIGYTAGDAIATGSNNVIIGDYAGTAALADTVAIYAGSTERLTIDATGGTLNGDTIATQSYVNTQIAGSSTSDLKGSVFADDSSLMVDGVNATLPNIRGTMTGHIIPSINAAYDLGNAEYKIRHLFLSSSSLWIGDNHKVDTEGGKGKFKKRKAGAGVVPSGVQTLLITSVFADTTALLVDFKTQIHDPAPANILDPDHADFNPPTSKWQEFLALHGHPNKTVDDIYNTATDFDTEKEETDTGTTEGDLIYFDGTKYARLPIGTADHVLTANGAGNAPEWKAPSGGGGGSGGAWILLDTTNVSAGSSSVDFTSSIITNTYTQYVIQITDLKPTTGQADLYCRMGNSSSFDSGGTDYYTRYHPNYASAAGIGLFDNSDKILMTNSADANGSINATIYLYSPSTATSETSINFQTAYTLNSNEVRHTFGAGARLEAAAHDMIQFYPSASTWASGTIKVYGIGTGSSGGGSGLDVADEGSDLTTTATKLDFVGAGVTASGTGVTKTITVPGGAFLEEFHIAGSGTSNGSSTITIPNNTARIEFDLVSGGGAQYDNTSTGPNGQGKTGTYTFTAGDLTALSGNSYQLTLQAGGYGGNENTGTAQPGKESWIRLNGTSIAEVQACIGGRVGGGQTAYCNGTNVSPTGCIDKSHWIPTYGEGSPNRVVGFVRVKCYS